MDGVIIMVDGDKKHKKIRTEQSVDVEVLCSEIDALFGKIGVGKDILNKDGIRLDGTAFRYPRPKRQAYVDYSETTPLYTHHYLALEPGLTGEALRVFHYACSILEFSNWCYLYPKVIAEKMRLKRQQVTRALSILENKGLLIRGEKEGRHYRWRLNPEVAWMGNNNHRWDLVEKDGIPYSDFTEKRLAWAEENGYNLSYLRYLKKVDDGVPDIALSEESKAAKKQKIRDDWRDNQERQRKYHRELWTRLYGKEYADGVDWKKLPEEEAARLHIREAKVRAEMEESGEWDALKRKYFPLEEKQKAQVIDFTQKTEQKRKAQKIAEKLSGKVDLDALENIDPDILNDFLKKNGTK